VNRNGSERMTSEERHTEGRSAGVLVVDDERTLRFTLAESLRDENYRAYEAADGSEAFAALRENDIDVVLLDMRLKESGEDGLTILKSIKKDYPEVEVVMMTAYGRFDHAVEATKSGCYQFVGKPFQLDQIKMVVRGALENASLRKEVEVLRRGSRARFPTDKIVGESKGFREVLETVEKVAPSRTTVLLTGETGTGKEIVARALHRASDVASGPFVAVNCSAVPENLLESELFGYEKGAFTDAKTRKKGMFELADRGTLFLDEIGDMAAGIQSKLLRVLETGTFKRLGGTGDIAADVRVVAATNKDLKKEVAVGSFREDLYYRLAVIPIAIPPLRERTEAILPLARFFLDHLNKEMGRNVEGFTPEAERALLGYRWPGNVRELRNVVERAVLLSSGPVIEASGLPREVLAAEGAPPPVSATPAEGAAWTLADAERYAIQLALKRFEGNKTRAAEALGVSRQTLRAKVKDYGLAESPTDD
jgi:two-component system response regulator AtoC